MVRYITEDEEEFLTLQEPSPKAYLSLLVGGHISQTFPLRGEVQLGREKGNAIVVADQKVSRHHAVLTPIDNTFIIHDQGSANGTYVNGVQIAQPTRLQDNDRIGIGDATFLFTLSQPDPNAIDRPPAPSPVVSIPPQPVAHSPMPMTADSNTPIWLLIGCMALAIVVLLVVLALMLGLFVGRSQQVGLALLWLASIA